MKTERSGSKAEYHNLKLYLTTLLLGVALVVAVIFYIFGNPGAVRAAGRSGMATVVGADITQHKLFNGGTHEASGATHISGTDAILFVDDGRPGEVFLMRLDQEGAQAGSIQAIPLGVNIEDQEGITTDGTYFYTVGSLSKKNSDRVGLIRFKLDRSRPAVEAVETITDLRKFLIENVGELRAFANVKASKDGINIEGLAWDGANNRLLLGLRSPVVGGDALLVTVTLRDPKGPFSNANLVAGAAAIRVPLGGLGFRSIEFDVRANQFRIIAGSTESAEKSHFRLYEWSGEANVAPREVAIIDRNLKPEGIARANVNGREFTVVVFDTSGYLKID